MPRADQSPERTTTKPHALALESLVFRYPNQPADTLRIEAFHADHAEQILLSGKSGAGKSTLLNLIMGLLEPTEGTVRVADRDIHKLTGADRDHFRGRNIGVVFQSFHLLHGFSAFENVLMPLTFSDIPPKEHDDRAKALLAELDISNPSALPENMSLGQQQRVAVARALACEPALILADEPTASLDPENATIAMDLIQKVCRDHNAAMLCVSHDPTLVPRFDRSLNLAELNIAKPESIPAQCPVPSA